MAVRVVERAPQTRCYLCGNTQIKAVCHQCARAMCDTHTPTVADSDDRPFSAEFADLGLQKTECREAPIHCKYCDHSVAKPDIKLIVAGVLFVLIGIFQPMDGLRWPLVLGGVGFSVLGGWIYWQQLQVIRRLRPLLPVLPRFERVKVQEILRGQVTLGPDGQYQAVIKPVVGQIEIAASFSKSERVRLERYRKKFLLFADEPVPFHAGFAVPRGPAGFRFDDDRAIPHQSGFVIPLRGMVSELPFFTDTVGRGAREWRVAHSYSLLDTPKDLTLPIRLAPSLAQERAQRVLELELQWVLPAYGANNLSIHQIKSLALSVPVSWGEILDQSDSAVSGLISTTADQLPLRSIVWKNLFINKEERDEARRTFTIQFEHAIGLTDTIQGHIEVTFKSVFSGLEGVDLYYPLGRQHAETDTASIQTIVSIDFELSLAGLRYQDMRMIPDPKCPRDRQKHETYRFEAVIPDHATIIALTNVISQQDFYVQHVIENRPHTMKQADVFNRYWDIAGRRYLGVYPIDFHLILTGEEVDGGDHRARSSVTKATLTVQGSFANPSMEQQIEQVWEQLQALIAETLCARRQAIEPLPSTVPPEMMYTMAERAVGDDINERVAMLYMRLDKYMQALAEGRISEHTFLELKSRTEQELEQIPYSI